MIPPNRRYPLRGWPDPVELLRAGHGAMGVKTPDLGWRYFAIDKVDAGPRGLLSYIENRGKVTCPRLS